MQSTQEFELNEQIKMGLADLYPDNPVPNVAMWQQELSAQNVDPLPTEQSLIDAGIAAIALRESSQPNPSWTDFNTTLLNDADWQAWLAEGSDLRTAIVGCALARNAVGLQSAFDVAIAVTPPPPNNWQAIADANNIPVSFAVG